MEKVRFPEVGEYKNFEKANTIAKEQGIDLESMAGKEVELPNDMVEKLSQLGIIEKNEKEEILEKDGEKEQDEKEQDETSEIKKEKRVRKCERKSKGNSSEIESL